MLRKKKNIYQHAEIILERMIKKIGMSQNKFAKEILGIAGGNITEARKSGKIPDRWFEVMEDKFGISKEELCKNLPQNGPSVGITTKSKDGTTSTVTFSMPYGNASDEEEKIHCLGVKRSEVQILSFRPENKGMRFGRIPLFSNI